MGPHTRYGFIGLGSIGLPMAQTIARSGLPLTVWARRPEATVDFPSEVTRALTPAELGANSDVVCLCVFDAAAVDEVLFGSQGVVEGLKPGAVILVHSTVAPQFVQDLEVRLNSVNLRLIDAPISGGPGSAADGDLTIMLGGSAQDCHEVDEIVKVLGANSIRLGDVGAGQKTKLMNNSLFTAQLGLTNSMLEIADELGIDRAAALQTLSTSSGQSFALSTFARGGNVEMMARGAALPALAKDVRILESLVGADSQVVSIAEKFVKLMESSLLTDNDEPTAVEGKS
ncbi:MAG: NAD(P)-dependent oxidoreductase [Actinomycetota bacterium]|nr:NAD(P)-dependent oxidoreductase [Actinomycetota bacterium]